MLRPHFLAFGLTMALSLAAAPLWAGSGPKPGSMAPSFSLPDLLKNNGEMSLRQLEGKVVLVDFWASWCPPCKKSLPELGQMRNRNPALVIVAISIDENRNKAVDFLKNSDTSLVYLHDAKHEAAEKFDLGGMPSAFLIDKKGMLRNRFDGYGSGSGELKSMEAEARKLLEEKP